MAHRKNDTLRKPVCYSFPQSTVKKIKKAAKEAKMNASQYVEMVLLEKIDGEGELK